MTSLAVSSFLGPGSRPLLVLVAIALAALAPEGAGLGAILLGALALAPSADENPPAASGGGAQRGAWRVLPLEGAFDILYRDAGGAFTRRRVQAREVRVGPGKVILGGADARSGGYRGFRADRIERIRDVGSGEGADRDVVDWLLRRAAPRRRPRAAVTGADAG